MEGPTRPGTRQHLQRGKAVARAYLAESVVYPKRASSWEELTMIFSDRRVSIPCQSLHCGRAKTLRAIRLTMVRMGTPPHPRRCCRWIEAERATNHEAFGVTTTARHNANHFEKFEQVIRRHVGDEKSQKTYVTVVALFS